MDFTNAPFIGNLPAADINRAMQWYEEKLGLKAMMDLRESGQLYQTGGVYWLIYQTPSAGTGKHTLGSFVVPDIDAAMAEMRAKGVVFEDYAMGDQGPTTENGVARGEGGAAVAWFTDSEGNVLSITQLPAGMSL
jgi:predicted enzyme related to lactoylglutathione lyase